MIKKCIVQGCENMAEDTHNGITTAPFCDHHLETECVQSEDGETWVDTGFPSIAFQDWTRALPYRTIALACPAHALSFSANTLPLDPDLPHAATMLRVTPAVNPESCCRKCAGLTDRARVSMVELVPWGLWIFQYLVEGLGQVPGHQSREGSQWATLKS